MNKRMITMCLVCMVLALGSWAHGSTLVTATNIAGSDGTPSMINVGTPPVPLGISNISGLALTNPDTPGDNLIIGGINNTPDVRVSDT